ncbi:hypothetical protein BVRB_017700 [Beta vulgaris subsp. vulgaris]|uniref:Uncharacterized protein n=1 Tax=Beta vulgaris subsp. vulgaris TaxID=3555 RepID=A0A0J7YNI1_BETVV|nr:hypothetical protein BVRB_017700 [Beta vulgaris subsp. vulgaris]
MGNCCPIPVMGISPLSKLFTLFLSLCLEKKTKPLCSAFKTSPLLNYAPLSQAEPAAFEPTAKQPATLLPPITAAARRARPSDPRGEQHSPPGRPEGGPEAPAAPLSSLLPFRPFGRQMFDKMPQREEAWPGHRHQLGQVLF